MAMSMGGDDFITKPFDLDVVVAKIGALMRRSYDFAAASAAPTHRGATLDAAQSVLRYGEQKLELTRNECRILQTLMEHQGAVVGRDTLMQRLWDSDCFIDDNTLTVNVAATAPAMRSRTASGKPSRSPMKARRTPRRCSSSTSVSSTRRNSFISVPTSSGGRFQFSVLKANRVRYSTP